jgi:succinate dehydrogenase / fumarate reductase cytochrome b subunit
MIYSGILIFVFLMFHLAHLTVGLVLPEYFKSTVIVEGIPRHDAYVMAVRGFQHIPIVLIYLAAMAVLFFHLCHGFTSLLQTIGIIPQKWSCFLHKVGPALAVLIFVGYASIPLACLTGILKLPEKPTDTSAEVSTPHAGGGR